ncbi:hypothetical protein Sango_1570000 [Sesamum angolense]|uniref:Retrotransposon gag domain-containing protein n=1 Tax=Sesamum angolense TaxID=2727404 RepID=A0AAE1WQC6_9LAMI|nr:hypothetical protein Sango_1570000 [Sesamum angolense]
MGLRRVTMTQANSTARMPGQNPESPRHAASPSERAANPEDENSRLTKLVMNLEEKVSSLKTEITVLNSELDECRQVVQETTSAFGGGGIADMRREMDQMSLQIGLLQHAVSNVPIVAHDPGAKLRIPEPKAYGGQPSATGYLGPSLGGNSRAVFPKNFEYNVRPALQKLEHTGSVRDYVKAFSTLMLNIRDMLEKDKLFTFMEGLKSWVRLELQQRQRVNDLGSAMAVAEPLIDLNPKNRRDRQTTLSPMQNKLGKARSFRSNSNRGKAAPAITKSHPEEEAQPRHPRKKRLMFVDLKIHGEPIRAMIDTEATHNYVASTEVERLELVLEKGVGRVKAINLAAQPIAGVAKSVPIKVGPFEGKTNLFVMVMDDFKLILEHEFLRDTRTTVMPHVDSLMILGAKPCIIPALAERTGEKNLSAM